MKTQEGNRPEIRIDARLNEVDAESQFKHLVPLLKAADAEIAQLAEEARQSSRSYQKVLARVFAHWQDLPADYPHLESWPTFARRVCGAITDIAQAAGSGANTVVVSSGGSIAAITQHVIGLPKTGAYPLFEALLNCSITRFLHTGTRIAGDLQRLLLSACPGQDARRRKPGDLPLMGEGGLLAKRGGRGVPGTESTA